MDREKVIKGLECCSADGEICPVECPYYLEPCYGFSVLMKDALALLKEQEEKKRKWLRSIADNQLANAPSDMMDEKTKEHFSGVWCGLEIAYGILTEES